MKKHKLYKGFTIIEVVLVLAIAGLIFLTVFLALPALQRSQRDAQRKSDIAIVRAAIENYRSNNKGSISGLKKYKGLGPKRLNEGPLAPYLSDGISSETEWYWLAGPVIEGGSGIAISPEIDHKVMIVYFDAECDSNISYFVERKVGGIAIMGSLENGKQSNDKQFGAINYCSDL